MKRCLNTVFLICAYSVFLGMTSCDISDATGATNRDIGGNEYPVQSKGIQTNIEPIPSMPTKYALFIDNSTSEPMCMESKYRGAENFNDLTIDGRVVEVLVSALPVVTEYKGINISNGVLIFPPGRSSIIVNTRRVAQLTIQTRWSGVLRMFSCREWINGESFEFKNYRVVFDGAES